MPGGRLWGIRGNFPATGKTSEDVEIDNTEVFSLCLAVQMSIDPPTSIRKSNYPFIEQGLPLESSPRPQSRSRLDSTLPPLGRSRE